MGRASGDMEDEAEGIPGQYAIIRRRTTSKTTAMRAAGAAVAASAATQGSRLSVRRMTSKETPRAPAKDAAPWMSEKDSVRSYAFVETACSPHGGFSNSSSPKSGAAWDPWSSGASASTCASTSGTPKSQMSPSSLETPRERVAAKDSCSPNSRQLPPISPAFVSRAAAKETTCPRARSSFKSNTGAPRRSALSAQFTLSPIASMSLTQTTLSTVVPIGHELFLGTDSSGYLDEEDQQTVNRIFTSEDIDAEFEQIFTSQEEEARKEHIPMPSEEEWFFTAMQPKDKTFADLIVDAKIDIQKAETDKTLTILSEMEKLKGGGWEGQRRTIRRSTTTVIQAPALQRRPSATGLEATDDGVRDEVVSRVWTKIEAARAMSKQLVDKPIAT